MKDTPSRHKRFLSELRLTKTTRFVLSRMAHGDWLRFKDTRTFLQSAELPKRASVELQRATVNSLLMRGLIYPDKAGDGEYVYPLTEHGELAARLIVEAV